MSNPEPCETRQGIGSPQLADAMPPSGQVRTANIYVDGFNLYYGCLRGTHYRWLDIAAFCQKLVPSNPINRIRYFTARVSALPGNRDAPSQQDAYLRALTATGGVDIHLGHFQQSQVRLPVADPEENGGHRTVKVIKTEEKGSDVNLASYMLRDAWKRESDIAVVVSNDSDLAEAIRIMTEEMKVPVGMVNPHVSKSRSRNLLNLDLLFFKQVRAKALSACQLPQVLSDHQGNEIHRPDSW